MKSVIIAGLAFSLSTPYAPGHTLTEAEAKTLNQVRHENIRNNCAKLVKDAEGDEAKTAELASKIAAYDAEYVFSIGGSGTSAARLDPVEREARAIAKEYIKAHLAKTNRTFKSVPEGMTEEEWKAKLEDNITSVAASEAVLKEARTVVKQKANRLDKLAESLNLG